MAGRTAAAGSKAQADPIRVRFAAFELDEANASLLRDGDPVALAPTPFAVLCALLARKTGRPVKIWFTREEESLDSHNR